MQIEGWGRGRRPTVNVSWSDVKQHVTVCLCRCLGHRSRQFQRSFGWQRWLTRDCFKRALRSSARLDYPRDSHTAIRVRFAPRPPERRRQFLRCPDTNAVNMNQAPLTNLWRLNFLGVAILLTLLPAFSLSATPSVDRWSAELQEREPYESPFVTFFHYGEKKLCFLASKHDPRRDSPTSRTIAAVIKECEPDILILEGLPTYISESDREGFVREAEKCEENPTFHECGELYWAIAEVKDAQTAIVGAEPGLEDELNFIVQQSKGELGLEDFVGYDISRSIIQAKRQGDFRLEDIPGIVADNLEYLRMFLPDIERYDEASYRKWLEDEVGLGYAELENSSYAPGNEEGSNLLQMMSYHSMMTRDHFAFGRIQELLKEADSIFVMYGSSHLATLRRALTEGSTRVVNKKYE